MTQSSNHDWQPCPPGRLARLAASERQAAPPQRRSPVPRTAFSAAAVALLLVVVASLIFWPHQPEGRDLPPIATLNCRQAVALFDDYRAKRLSAAQVAALEKHLDDCPGCAKRLRHDPRH